ncbi:MAG: HesA/MoeB/ThiF family protein [Myxococcales bacterium]|nr:HesA/MoeB/ThiF family protein [Myxococcales bacterium]
MIRRALIAGAGGLGCPASLALARAGVPELTIADPDRVDASNLHRQLWHRTSDVGRLKVESAADHLRQAFPGLRVQAMPVSVGADNALELFHAHDVVIDGTDRAGAKFLLSDASVLTGVPLVYGGVLRMSGQAMRIEPGGPCLRCVFERPPPPELVPACAEAGVLGPMAGVIGALQAVLALDGLPRPEWARLVVVDGESFSQRVLNVRPAKDCAACGPTSRGRLSLIEPAEAQCAS